MSRFSDASRFARTVAGLSPAQVASRLRLRGQRAVLGRLGDAGLARLASPIPAEPGWPAAMVALDADFGHNYPGPVANAEGRFEFLGVTHDVRLKGADVRAGAGAAVGAEGDVGVGAQAGADVRAGAGADGSGSDAWDWRPESVSQLWRYHLHYFEWAWSFMAHADQAWARDAFGELFAQWQRGTLAGRWDEWSPYVVSLRVWNLAAVFDGLLRGGPHAEAAVDQIAASAGFLRHNLETDVGGNHLIKNLKGLIGAGVFLDDHELVDLVALPRLRTQVDVQVLSDGGHFERSPSYHGQVLGDLIDINNLLASTGRVVPWLPDAIRRMRRWQQAMVHPDGEIAMFNDATALGPARLDALLHQPLLAPALVSDARQSDAGGTTDAIRPVGARADVHPPDIEVADGAGSDVIPVDGPATGDSTVGEGPLESSKIRGHAESARAEAATLASDAVGSSAAVTALVDSGYVVMRRPHDWYVVMDVGAPGPRQLPAHIHADALSLELSVGGRRLVVDTGTSTYDPGPRRAVERSTAAHNTVVVDGHDQSEVWGLFRAGRLAEVYLEELVEDDTSVRVVASQHGYAHRPGAPVHRRTVVASTDALVVTDEITGTGSHAVELRWHFAPEVLVMANNEAEASIDTGSEVTDASVVADNTRITIAGPGQLRIIRPGESDEVRVATEFGTAHPTHALVWSCEAELPISVTTTFTPQNQQG